MTETREARNLNKMRLELEQTRVQTGIAEQEFRIAELETDIDRLKLSIEASHKRLAELKTLIAKADNRI